MTDAAVPGPVIILFIVALPASAVWAMQGIFQHRDATNDLISVVAGVTGGDPGAFMVTHRAVERPAVEVVVEFRGLVDLLIQHALTGLCVTEFALRAVLVALTTFHNTDVVVLVAGLSLHARIGACQADCVDTGLRAVAEQPVVAIGIPGTDRRLRRTTCAKEHQVDA